MSNWIRGVVIALCVLAIFYLAHQFGVGVSEDPSMQATPAASVPQR